MANHTTLNVDKDLVRDLKILVLEADAVGLEGAPKNVTQWIISTMRAAAAELRQRIEAARAGAKTS